MPDTATPEFFMDVKTDLGCATIRSTWLEFFEIEPANHTTFRLCDPEWILLRRMFAEPRQPRVDCRRLKLGCHHACRHSYIINLNDDWKVSLNSVTDDHFVRDTVLSRHGQVRHSSRHSEFKAYVSWSGSALQRVISSTQVPNQPRRSPPDWAREMQRSVTVKQILSPMHQMKATRSHSATRADSTLD